MILIANVTMKWSLVRRSATTFPGWRFSPIIFSSTTECPSPGTIPLNWKLRPRGRQNKGVRACPIASGTCKLCVIVGRYPRKDSTSARNSLSSAVLWRRICASDCLFFAGSLLPGKYQSEEIGRKLDLLIYAKSTHPFVKKRVACTLKPVSVKFPCHLRTKRKNAV